MELAHLKDAEKDLVGAVAQREKDVVQAREVVNAAHLRLGTVMGQLDVVRAVIQQMERDEQANAQKADGKP